MPRPEAEKKPDAGSTRMGGEVGARAEDGEDGNSLAAASGSSGETRADSLGEVTRFVNSIGAPSDGIDGATFQRIYDELRRLASIALNSERDRGALQTTALVHEALIKMRLFEGPHEWQSKAHFFGAAARSMRQILVGEARRRRSEGRILRILSDASEHAARAVDVLELDGALTALEAHDEGLARVVVLRVFGGMQNEEVAMMLDRSVRSILRDWTIARAWILRWLSEHGVNGE